MNTFLFFGIIPYIHYRMFLFRFMLNYTSLHCPPPVFASLIFDFSALALLIIQTLEKHVRSYINKYEHMRAQTINPNSEIERTTKKNCNVAVFAKEKHCKRTWEFNLNSCYKFVSTVIWQKNTHTHLYIGAPIHFCLSSELKSLISFQVKWNKIK